MLAKHEPGVEEPVHFRKAPSAARTPDAFGVRGGVELALMSATTDYEVALFYASQGGPATILEMRCGLMFDAVLSPIGV